LRQVFWLVLFSESLPIRQLPDSGRIIKKYSLEIQGKELTAAGTAPGFHGIPSGTMNRKFMVHLQSFTILKYFQEECLIKI